MHLLIVFMLLTQYSNRKRIYTSEVMNDDTLAHALFKILYSHVHLP